MSVTGSFVRSRPFERIALLFLLVCAGSGDEAAAQRFSADRTAARIVAGLAIAEPLRRPLQAAMAQAFRDETCDDTEFSARLVDLNDDALPEVHVYASGPCVNSMAGGFNWVFVGQAVTGAWNPNLTFTGGLIPLASRSRGFVDIVVAGPGFVSPVWRWNGREYALHCRSGTEHEAHRNTCPPSLSLRPSGDELPAFPGAPNICGARGRFAVFAQRPLGRAPIRVPAPDAANLSLAHEQLFFCVDGIVVENMGFAGSGGQMPDDPKTAAREKGAAGTILVERPSAFGRYTVTDTTRYDFDLMSQVIGQRICVPARYNVITRNCQDWADAQRREYRERLGSRGAQPRAGGQTAPAGARDVVGEWRVRETMRGNVAGWPTRCTSVGVLRIRVEGGALSGQHRTERLECRTPAGTFRHGPFENRFAVEFRAPALRFMEVEGCPYTATLSGTKTELRGTLQCTIGDEANEPMSVTGEWVATRQPPAR